MRSLDVCTLKVQGTTTRRCSEDTANGQVGPLGAPMTMDQRAELIRVDAEESRIVNAVYPDPFEVYEVFVDGRGIARLETWRRVPDHESYAISDYGRVRSYRKLPNGTIEV